MDLSVLIEPVAGNGYRAIGTEGLSVGLTAVGSTRDEAMDKLLELVKARAAAGAEVCLLHLAVEPHPLAAQAGWLRNDPMYDAWRQAIEEYRRKLDEDPDAL